VSSIVNKSDPLDFIITFYPKYWECLTRPSEVCSGVCMWSEVCSEGGENL